MMSWTGFLKPGPPKPPTHGISTRSCFRILWLVMTLANLGDGICHDKCDCKWADGKETVICAGAHPRMIKIPQGLDPGTQVLDMSRNDLQALSKAIFADAGLPNLQKVYLVDCHIKSIHNAAFVNLTNLVHLDLTKNKLEEIPSNAFRNLINLKELKLTRNKLSTVPARSFEGLRHLIKLDLSENEIKFVADSAFDDLRSLDSLRLEYNSISRLSYHAIENLISLMELRLHENPWTCDCKLLPLRKFMSKNRVPYSVPPLCKRPGRLHDKSWEELALDEYACPPRLRPVGDGKSSGNSVAYDSGNATLQCEALSIPGSEVYWEYRGVRIGNGSLVQPLSSLPILAWDQTFIGTSPEEVRVISSIFIMEVEMKEPVVEEPSSTDPPKDPPPVVPHVEDFHCIAFNKAGSVFSNVTLTIIPKPPAKDPTFPVTAGVVLFAAFFCVGGLIISCVVCNKRRKTTFVNSSSDAVSRRGHNGRANMIKYEDVERVEMDAKERAEHIEVDRRHVHPNEMGKHVDPSEILDLERAAQQAVQSCLEELENTPDDNKSVKSVDMVNSWLDQNEEQRKHRHPSGGALGNGSIGGGTEGRRKMLRGDRGRGGTKRNVIPLADDVKGLVNDFRRSVDLDSVVEGGGGRSPMVRFSRGGLDAQDRMGNLSDSPRSPLLSRTRDGPLVTSLCTLPRSGPMSSRSSYGHRYELVGNGKPIVEDYSMNSLEDLRVSPTLLEPGTLSPLPQIVSEPSDFMQQFLDEYESLQTELEEAKERYRTSQRPNGRGGVEYGSDVSDFDDRSSSLDDREDVPLHPNSRIGGINKKKLPRVLPPYPTSGDRFGASSRGETRRL